MWHEPTLGTRLGAWAPDVPPPTQFSRCHACIKRVSGANHRIRHRQANRSGLGACRQLITLGFHRPPLRMFPIDRGRAQPGRRNEIVIDFADPGSITAGFLAKEPGATMKLGAAEMTFRYANSFNTAYGLEGYERLLLDAMNGDQIGRQRWVA